MALTDYPSNTGGSPIHWVMNGFDAKPTWPQVMKYDYGLHSQTNLCGQTAQRRVFTLPYRVSPTEMATLKAFFNARKSVAEAFNFTYLDATGATIGPITVRFNQAEFPNPMDDRGYHSFTITLIEEFNVAT